MAYINKKTLYQLKKWVDDLSQDNIKDLGIILPVIAPIREKIIRMPRVPELFDEPSFLRRHPKSKLKPKSKTELLERIPKPRYFETEINKEKILWLLDALGRKTDYFDEIVIKDGKLFLTVSGIELLKQAHKLVAEKLTGQKHKKSSSKFFDNEVILEVDGFRIQLPPYKNEHFFCRAIFEYSLNEPVDWEPICEKMTGLFSGDSKLSWRKVYDTMESINKRIKEKGLSKLFIWQEKSVKRLR
jgi:hypothetical protein